MKAVVVVVIANVKKTEKKVDQKILPPEEETNPAQKEQAVADANANRLLIFAK